MTSAPPDKIKRERRWLCLQIIMAGFVGQMLYPYVMLFWSGGQPGDWYPIAVGLLLSPVSIFMGARAIEKWSEHKNGVKG